MPFEEVTIGPCRLIRADAMDVLPTLEAGSVDAVVTDPPYGVEIAAWDDSMPPQSILNECFRITSGPVVWFGAATNLLAFAHYDPKPERILVWAPRFTLSKIAKDGFAYRFHPIAVWRSRKQSVMPWDVLQDNTECGNWWEHSCTKPLALMAKLVEGFVHCNVIDPFMGSGTTLVAAIETGKQSIGIEREPRYFDIACRRIEEAWGKGSLYDDSRKAEPELFAEV